MFAIDCEMVGCGVDGKDSVLARCSIVDENCESVLDLYVLPQSHETIVNYRTEFSGITEKLLETSGVPFDIVRDEVIRVLKDSTVIGHSVMKDFATLWLFPKDYNIIVNDTTLLYMKKNPSWKKLPALKTLVRKEFNEEIQKGIHNSAEDAAWSMKLYKKYMNNV